MTPTLALSNIHVDGYYREQKKEKKEKKEGDTKMLYCHYEKKELIPQIAETPALVVVKFVFCSSADERAGKGTTKIGKSDWEHARNVQSVIKQIPSAQRSYDAVTHIWTIPAEKLQLLIGLMASQGMPDTCIDHTLRGGLDTWFTPVADDNHYRKSWHEQVMGSGRVKVEAAEDFFKNTTISTTSLPISEIEMKLRTIILGVMPSLTLTNKEEFLRGYKLASRKLHPDFNGGDGTRMSELNSLWSQYKEVYG